MHKVFLFTYTLHKPAIKHFITKKIVFLHNFETIKKTTKKQFSYLLQWIWFTYQIFYAV